MDFPPRLKFDGIPRTDLLVVFEFGMPPNGAHATSS
jgi:hypothetical protein